MNGEAQQAVESFSQSYRLGRFLNGADETIRDEFVNGVFEGMDYIEGPNPEYPGLPFSLRYRVFGPGMRLIVTDALTTQPVRGELEAVRTVTIAVQDSNGVRKQVYGFNENGELVPTEGEVVDDKGNALTEIGQSIAGGQGVDDAIRAHYESEAPGPDADGN